MNVNKHAIFIYVLLALLAATQSFAQSVSASGGTPGAVPFFSDPATLVNSSIVDIPPTAGVSSGGITTAQPVIINGASIDNPPVAALTVNRGSVPSPAPAVLVTGYQQYGYGVGLTLLNRTGEPNWGATTNILFAGGEAPDGWAMIQGAGWDWSGGGDGFLDFQTKWNGEMEARMTLSPTGNLGIGTTLPQAELSIVTGNPTTETAVHVVNPDSTGYSAVRLGIDGIGQNGSAWAQFNSGWTDDQSSATGAMSTSILAFEAGGLNLATTNPLATMRFFTGGDTASNERFRIDSLGNVGIGTPSPAAKLDVNGTVRANSFQLANGASLLSSSSPNFTGNVGIGTTAPQASIDAVSQAVPLLSNYQAFGNANVIIEATGPRTVSAGAALSFATAENTDGSGMYEQGRLITTADNSNNADASGRMYIQTRSNTPGMGWTWTNNLVLTSDGSVGIGIAAPGQALHAVGQAGPVLEVNGSVHIHGNLYFDNPSLPQSVPYQGNACPAGGDYAESVDIVGDEKDFEPGDTIVISRLNHGHFEKSTTPYSKLVAGIYSTKPGFVGRRQTADRATTREIPMAMVGIVPANVTNENGEIEDGDLLVTSSRAGYLMKGTETSRMLGAIVGKALGQLNTAEGTIEVLVTLQ